MFRLKVLFPSIPVVTTGINSFRDGKRHCMMNLWSVCLVSVFCYQQTLVHGNDAIHSYAFKVGFDNIFTKSQRFGCDAPGCSVTSTWNIEGVCIKPNVTLSVSQTDVNSDSEQVMIYVNDEYLGNCTELDGECQRDDWKQCGVVNEYFENTTFLYYGTQITITLAATDEINRCPYYFNGTNYYLFAQLTIECDSFDDYGEYIWNSNGGTDDESIQQFGCDTIDCNVLGMWEISDDCAIPTLSVAVIDTNATIYNYNNNSDDHDDGLLYISVNDNNLGLCEFESNPMNNNNTYNNNNDKNNNTSIFKDCANVYKYPVYDYLLYQYGHDGQGNYLFVQLNYSNWQLYNGNETTVAVAIECVDIDYKFELGFSGTYRWPNDDDNHNTGQFGCDYYGCDISKMWQIVGICTRPRLALKIMDMNYFENTSVMVDINGVSNVIQYHVSNVTSHDCSDSQRWITCEENYDLSHYIDTSIDVNNNNYLHLNIYTNDDGDALCPWNSNDDDYYLYVDVSLSCFVPDQCVLDSDLPRIITIVLIVLSTTTAIGVVVAGTFVAYKKGQQKGLQQMIQASIASHSSTPHIDNQQMDLEIDIIDDDMDDQKQLQDADVYGAVVSHAKLKSPLDAAQLQKEIFFKFCKYLPKEIMRKKRCYFPCITHLIDQSTDIAVIFEFYQLYVFENIPNSNGTKNDCSGVNAEQLLILSCIAFMFYRFISCVWIYNITRSIFHTLLQFFDLKIYHALYINFISEYNDGNPNTAQKYIQILEASLEAFPQVIIQLYFFIQVKMDIEKYWIVFASLIMSLYNVSNKMASEDRIYFIQSWQNVFVGYCKINVLYLFRYIVRICDIFQRILLILLLWIGIGGFYCALYIIVEMVGLSILSFFTKEYVI